MATTSQAISEMYREIFTSIRRDIAERDDTFWRTMRYSQGTQWVQWTSDIAIAEPVPDYLKVQEGL